MGTNYYWKVQQKLVTGEDVPIRWDSPTIHIGKISGAGAYCVRCRRTLCKGGESKIHYGVEYYQACPTCGSTYNSLPSYIIAASSLSWAQDPDFVRRVLGEHLDEEVVVDEYGGAMTGRTFLKEIDGCHVQFVEHVGREFS